MSETVHGKRGPGRPAGVHYPPKAKPKVVINGDLVADLRMAMRMPQHELGDRCHLTQAQVSAIEKGGVESRLSALFFLSKALRRPMEDLVMVQEDEG